MKKFLVLVACFWLAIGSNVFSTEPPDVGLLRAQSLQLVVSPTEGFVHFLEDGSGIVYFGPRDAFATFSVSAVDDYGLSTIEVLVDGSGDFATYGSPAGSSSGPKAIAGVFRANSEQDVVAFTLYINRPLAASIPNGGDVDYPVRDGTGRCHEPDFPVVVPEIWLPGVLDDALHEIEESIRQRLRDIVSPTADPLLEPGHRERIRREEEWARRLRNRIAQLSRVTVGASLVVVGTYVTAVGVGGSAVILADDITVIGVVDDPLIIVTGGVAIVGGGLILVGEFMN